MTACWLCALRAMNWAVPSPCDPTPLPPQMCAHGCQSGQLFRFAAGDVGRDAVYQRFYRLHHLLDVVPIIFVRLGILGRMTGDFVVILLAVGPQEQIVAVFGGGEVVGHRQHHQAVFPGSEHGLDARIQPRHLFQSPRQLACLPGKPQLHIGPGRRIAHPLLGQHPLGHILLPMFIGV